MAVQAVNYLFNWSFNPPYIYTVDYPVVCLSTQLIICLIILLLDCMQKQSFNRAVNSLVNHITLWRDIQPVVRFSVTAYSHLSVWPIDQFSNRLYCCLYFFICNHISLFTSGLFYSYMADWFYNCKGIYKKPWIFLHFAKWQGFASQVAGVFLPYCI